MNNSSLSSDLIDQLISTGKVAAIGLGGSRASGESTASSDLDIYVLVNEPIDPDERRRIAESLVIDKASIEIANPWWGDEDGFEIDGLWHDIVYFDAVWFFDTIAGVLNHHRASEGYTTSFVYTLAQMQPVYDPDHLIARWQRYTVTYPEPLIDSIIATNYPVSCTIHSCYRNQIARAVHLNDPLAVNHRVAAFLACVCDIAFAVARAWHPGEKRQLRHLARNQSVLPPQLTEHIEAVAYAIAPDRMHTLRSAVDQVVDDVHVMVAKR